MVGIVVACARMLRWSYQDHATHRRRATIDALRARPRTGEIVREIVREIVGSCDQSCTPQRMLAGSAASIFLGYGRLRPAISSTNSLFDLVRRGFVVFSVPIVE